MYGTIDTLWLMEAIVSILMKVLRWSRTIAHLFLRICYIVYDIVHFKWMRGCINNYPHPICGIYRYEFKKKENLYMIALFSIHFIHLSTSFFFQSQNSVYIFPHISPSGRGWENGQRILWQGYHVEIFFFFKLITINSTDRVRIIVGTPSHSYKVYYVVHYEANT